MALLEIDNLKTQFRIHEGTVHAVDGVSLNVEEGQTLGLVGESGCGKSVTALSIMRLLADNARIAEGSIRFDGQDLATFSERQMQRVRGMGIAMIFQDPMTSLNPTLRIGTQLTETMRTHLGLDRTQARKRAVKLLEQVRIPNASERINDYPHHFSGGMRQRVMIAMAISCNPRLLIADEPTTALDVTVQAEILELLENLQKEREMAMLLITHDMGVVAQTADEIAVMYAGQIVEQASTRELFARPEHPYTEALLGSIPRLDDPDARSSRLATITGRPPDLLNPPTACRFAGRCPCANLADSCTQVAPNLRELRPGHWVRSAHPRSERGCV